MCLSNGLLDIEKQEFIIFFIKLKSLLKTVYLLVKKT